ncbi:hypothetical protein I7105_005077 [Vibrio parahaemolyticus]|nr:hypothetical protein [Vibrio parahaemolyticus]
MKRFEPKKLTTNRPENRIRQPAKLGMFYVLSHSRTWEDKAKLPINWDKYPKRNKRFGPRNFLLRLTPC